MIARAYSYSGARSDGHRLDVHLWKNDGQRPSLIEARNLYINSSADGMQVMAALKAASRAQTAFWHIIVSPRKTLSGEEREEVVDLILAEFGANSHPLMVFSHDEKPRAQRGGGANHLHLVLGHVSPVSFRALNMSQHAPRLHKVMAIAAYRFEGVPTASPWHKSIVKALRREDRSHIADWLTDSFGETPVLRAPRMTGSMRRSAQAANFELPNFQAGLERLWTTGAGQPEVERFLRDQAVVVVPGRLPSVIAFYHGKLFVGVLHRILRNDVSTVYQEAKYRIPRLLNLDAVGPVAEIPDSEMPLDRYPAAPVSRLDRAPRLELQKKIDEFEDKLTNLRLERLYLIYQSGYALADASKVGSVSVSASLSTPDDSGPNFDSTAEAIAADRIKRLLHAEAVLDAAVALLWWDHRWGTRSARELLRRAKVIVNLRCGAEGNMVSSCEFNPEKSSSRELRPLDQDPLGTEVDAKQPTGVQ